MAMHHTNDSLRDRISVRDPIPEALADSLWLGGEAMIAPMNLRWHSHRSPSQPSPRSLAAFPPATESDADPSWLVI
jgi:hypothetical protein